MRFIEILRKESTLPLLFAVLFLIPFQTVLLFPFSIESLSLLREQPEILFHYNPFLTIGYFLLPIFYCIFVSLLFTPKRLVNPVYIQTGAFFLYSIFVINSFLDNTITSETFSNLFGILFFVAIYIMTIAIAQFFIVWWVIGLNYDGSDRKTFIINDSPENVKKILGKEFLKTRKFSRLGQLYKDTDNPVTILKCDDNFRNNVVIAFGRLPDSKNKCIMATIAFNKSISWISKSSTASAICDAIVNDISERLKKANSKLKVIQLNNEYDLVSTTALGFVESLTRTKIEAVTQFFQKIPKFFRYTILLTILVFIILSVACYLDYLDVNSYIVGIVPTIIALIFEVGIPLKDELSLRKADDFI